MYESYEWVEAPINTLPVRLISICVQDNIFIAIFGAIKNLSIHTKYNAILTAKI